MSWNRIAELWEDLVDQILQRWPATERPALIAASGAQERVAAHLAQAHHLTLNEALEELDLWRDSLARRA